VPNKPGGEGQDGATALKSRLYRFIAEIAIFNFCALSPTVQFKNFKS
jgi:hypothetical protein